MNESIIFPSSNTHSSHHWWNLANKIFYRATASHVFLCMALMGVDVSCDRILKAAESIWDPRDASAPTAAVAVFGSSLSQSLVQASPIQSPPLSSPARKVKQIFVLQAYNWGFLQLCNNVFFATSSLHSPFLAALSLFFSFEIFRIFEYEKKYVIR